MTPATLLDATVPRTLDSLLQRIRSEAPADGRVEAWVFESLQERRKAEVALASEGYTARIRSAYKPLVHALIEEIPIIDATRVHLRLPNHPQALPGRFLIEAYPLAGLLDDCQFSSDIGESLLSYFIEITRRDGSTSTLEVFAPNRVTKSHLGTDVLRPTGWLRIRDRDGTSLVDEAVHTEYEAIYEQATQIVLDYPLGVEPYFQRLEIDVAVPGGELPLHFGEEVLSPMEGLQLDLFWMVLEVLQQRSGRALADFRLKGCFIGGDFAMRPGQIVPVVRPADGAPSIRMLHLPLPRDEAAENFETHLQVLATAGAPLDPRQIDGELDALAGERFAVPSIQGRTIMGTYVRGTGPGVMITGAQHPNETTGVIGALRAAHELRRDPSAHFAIIPVSNPDGYDLHRRMMQLHPRYMNSAPRFSAHGSDIAFRSEEPFDEIEAWREAYRLTGAGLHVNLHAINSHEVNRPLSGYLMRSWAHLMIPKGFYLIMFHHAKAREDGRWLLEKITSDLAGVPGLAAFNDRQQRVHRAHVGDGGYELINDVPCFMVEKSDSLAPLMLITEYPDVTLLGDAYRLGHTTQMVATLSAIRHFTTLR